MNGFTGMAVMISFTFVIPLSRDDLMRREISDQYCVQNPVTIRELPEKLKGKLQLSKKKN